MENIVYILGAGFSAPIGLPVMNNFIDKSKDMLFNYNDKSDFDYFDSIFKMIKDISFLKNYIKSNLFNIEEILSTLEMGLSIGTSKTDIKEFKKYIKDVINFYTPKIDFRIDELKDSNWHQFVFGKNNLSHLRKADGSLGNYNNFPFIDKDFLNLYGVFICYLFNLRIERTINPLTLGTRPMLIDQKDSRNYSLITLNYDEVIENIVNLLIINFMNGENRIELIDTNDDNPDKIKYAKLHGSVSKEIMLPTWSKNISDPFKSTWELAYNILKNANEIRIIGYSLPPSDNYVKYLFINAFKDSKNLKKIDVITIDDDGEVEKRYRNLFILPNFKFKNSNFLEFLLSLYPPKQSEVNPGSDKRQIEFYPHILENKHKEFMSI